MEKTMHIEGMMCPHCEARVKKILENLAEVDEAVVSHVSGTAVVTLNADVAVSVTGLAGPAGDEYGNPVGRVYIGYCDALRCASLEYTFSGDREAVRAQAVEEALKLILKMNKENP